MLSLLRIANYAIIDEVELELGPGFSVMTGETGAGKSILVDALGLALGDRADATAVRRGAKRAEISVVFDVADDHPAAGWLLDRGLDNESTCCLRRLISAEGRSRAFINNQPATLTDLRELGGLLVDIHGQHAHQSLLGAAAQRRWLDASAGLTATSQDVATAFRDWQDVARDLNERSAQGADREAQLELLRFQLGELEDLQLADGEVEQLQNERSRLVNVDKLMQGLNAALERLYEADAGSAHTLLAQATRGLDSLRAHDDALEPMLERLHGVEIELNEVASELARYRDQLEAEPERLEAVETRLDRVRHLARRHRVEPIELYRVAGEVAEQLERLDSGAASLEALRERVEHVREAYFARAADLSAGRRAHAEVMGAQVSDKLKELGMPHGELRVRVRARDEEQADGTGLDDIRFEIEINPGQGYGPLSRVASGGELSRISLALEVIAVDASIIPTYIFDEVDAGIGGGTAEIVGRHLRQIADTHQVLCVTHLPQVASVGSDHYKIIKLTDGQTSRTQVRKLSDDERVDELSRMLGGLEITAATRAHAAEMIRQGGGR